jgi:uncharacterized protein involved in cysteine biosynthesis
MVSMSAVAKSLALAVGQLSDRPVLKVLAKSLAITTVVLGVLAFALAESLPRLLSHYLDVQGDTYVVLSWIISLAAVWFLFRIVALAVMQFFADEVVLTVEQRHYPECAKTARKLPFREDLSNSVLGAGRALLFNALALPIALVLFFTAIGPAVVFLLVNAVLLGRELTDMGWLRHRPGPDATTPVSSLDRLLLGGAIAGLMAIPFANLLAPIIGAAAGTHLVQLSRKKLP